MLANVVSQIIFILIMARNKERIVFTLNTPN